MLFRRNAIRIAMCLLAAAAAVLTMRAAGVSWHGDEVAGPGSLPGPVGVVLTSPGPGLPAPGFAAGEVVLIDGDLLYLRTDRGDRVVRAAGASVWKGEAASLSDIEVGDTVTASGTALVDGTIDAKTIDVNIVQVRGVVLKVEGPGHFVARDNFGHEQTLRIDAEKPPVEVLAGGQPLHPGTPVTVGPGQPFIAIGVRLADGTVRVTRLYL